MKIEEDPTCTVCGEEEETAHHFLGMCKGKGERFHTLGVGEIKEEELAKLEWQDILSFITQTGRFEGRTVVD